MKKAILFIEPFKNAGEELFKEITKTKIIPCSLYPESSLDLFKWHISNFTVDEKKKTIIILNQVQSFSIEMINEIKSLIDQNEFVIVGIQGYETIEINSSNQVGLSLRSRMIRTSEINIVVKFLEHQFKTNINLFI